MTQGKASAHITKSELKTREQKTFIFA